VKQTVLAVLVFIWLVPIWSAHAQAEDSLRLPASGTFAAQVDFSTLELTPAGARCLLEVSGVLVFSGTIVGEAPGTTRALVFASCEEVAQNPPGAFKDVFRSRLEFFGTLGGAPVVADLTYAGITEQGGTIKAVMHFSNGLRGLLSVEAVVAQGGSYQGFIESSPAHGKESPPGRSVPLD